MIGVQMDAFVGVLILFVVFVDSNVAGVEHPIEWCYLRAYHPVLV